MGIYCSPVVSTVSPIFLGTTNILHTGHLIALTPLPLDNNLNQDYLVVNVLAAKISPNYTFAHTIGAS